MVYDGHLLNLIDTPGHVDFSFEVHRSLAACEGILLLVAANQGVQAQTIANFELAFEKDLTIIPVINKIDLSEVNVEKLERELNSLWGFESSDILRVSAKQGLNIKDVLDAIVQRVPAPKGSRDDSFRALIFDSWFEHFRGGIACVAVKEGCLQKGHKMIRSYHGDKDYDISEIGVMTPKMTPSQKLYAGQVGYIVANMRSAGEAAVGETLYSPEKAKEEVTPLPGFATLRPTVFSGLYPVDSADYDDLKEALDRLCLNDPAVTIQPETSPALGFGWRVGFLGVLHMEVFAARLDNEYDASVIVTSPSVEYRAKVKDNETIRKKRFEGKAEISITDPSKFPATTDIEAFLEPMVLATMVVPQVFVGDVLGLCNTFRGRQPDVQPVDEERVLIKCRLPLAEVVVNFFDRLKTLTSGYASFDYEDDGYQETALVKVMVWINDRAIDEFSVITPLAMAMDKAKWVVRRLVAEIPRQQYEVVVKATVGDSSKAAVMRKITSMGKDFGQQLKGNFSDATRLNKKLKHQQKGKKRMKTIGKINIPKEAFVNVLKTR